MDLKEAWEIERNVPPGDDSGKIVALIRIIRILEKDIDTLRARHLTYATGIAKSLEDCRDYMENGEPVRSDRSEIKHLKSRLETAERARGEARAESDRGLARELTSIHGCPNCDRVEAQLTAAKSRLERLSEERNNANEELARVTEDWNEAITRAVVAENKLDAIYDAIDGHCQEYCESKDKCSACPIYHEKETSSKDPALPESEE